MAYSEYLADRVRPRLKGKGELEEKKMMGGLTFMVNGKMCICIMFDKKSEEDKLMVRVGKLNYEELLNKPGSRPMDFTGKPLRGFVFIGPDGFDTEDDLDFWVDKALEFNRLLNA
ncbi:TfoX/Sxy family protein [uncultured Maribacter sp.]|uniref:TfoX/Sxy family protein n=1 Tax=uncultured Maribacter sp. TaxID=431308 RepID=UPI00260FDE62|nr:TfoX/Sxy family protein [uncultured Maribacter sp.]